MKIRTLDLFCGAGGSSAGMVQNKEIELVAGIDNDSKAIKTYNDNLGNIGIEYDLRNSISNSFQDIDYIHGSPPCKGFSTAGNMDEDDERSELTLEFVKKCVKLDPQVITMENVPELRNFDLFDTIKTILSDYHIETVVVECSEFGIPQTRERMIMFATKQEFDFSMDKYKEAKVPVSDVVDKNGFTHQTSQYNEPRQLKEKVSLRTLDEPAYTLRGSTPSARINKSDLPTDSITNIDSDRFGITDIKNIQGFPSWFKFDRDLNRTTIYEQVGNSVPSKLQRKVTREVIRYFMLYSFGS